MGQYKVPQNVEAEDKIIGSLTIRQFIYAVIGVGWGLVSFALLRSLPVFFLVFGVPPALLFLTLGIYKRHDQPFENLFLAMISFWVKPRKRIWKKEPIAQIFTVEAPVVVTPVVRDDPDKVKGQLEKLAQIVDTRGWSLKQSELQEPHADSVNLAARMESSGVAPVPTQPIDVHAADDMLDMQNNPQAHNIGLLIQNHTKSIREEVIRKVRSQKARASESQSVRPADNPTLRNPANVILKPDYEDLKLTHVAAQAKKHNVMTEGKEVKVAHGQK